MQPLADADDWVAGGVAAHALAMLAARLQVVELADDLERGLAEPDHLDRAIRGGAARTIFCSSQAPLVSIRPVAWPSMRTWVAPARRLRARWTCAASSRACSMTRSPWSAISSARSPRRTVM